MVKVISSRGGFVQVEVKGVAAAAAFIRKKGHDIKDGSDAGVFQAANFVQQEVQESIIGRRAEPKSVDTGRLGNSIIVEKIKDEEYKILPEKQFYPGTNTTTQQVATILEFGTSKIFPRRHFGNTEKRTKEPVRKIIDKEIDLAIKRQLAKFKKTIF